MAENTAAACQDRVDNDGDGYVDCQDQDCGMIVTCARGPVGPPGPGLGFPLARRRSPYGRGLAVGGIVLSSLGVSLMAVAVGLGFGWPEGADDDGLFGACIGTGSFGFLFSEIGTGLILGALLRTIRYSRANRIPAGSGSYIAGWILWGLTAASIVVSGVLEAFYDLIEGPFYLAPLTLGLAAFITTLVGWGVRRNYVSRALAARPTSWNVIPLIATSSHGVTLGIAGYF